MDFIEGLPKLKGNDTILVVVDQLSKYANFLSLFPNWIVAAIAYSSPDLGQYFYGLYRRTTKVEGS